MFSKLFKKQPSEPIDVEASLQAAFYLGDSRDPANRDKAIALYQNIVKESPDCHVAWFNLGVVQSRAGKWQAGVQSFRQAERSARLRTVAAYARLKVLVENRQKVSAMDFPAEFREGQSLKPLGVQGPCHNAVNELRRRGYASTAEGKGTSCSIVTVAGPVKYTITLSDIAGGLIRNVYREEDNLKVNLGDVKELSGLDKEFLNLTVGSLDLVQAPVTDKPPAETRVDDLPLWQSTAASAPAAHAWVRQGHSFAELLAQRKADADPRGINLVQPVTPQQIARDNWNPGTVFVYVLDGEPHALAMLHQLQPDQLPAIQKSVTGGTCQLRGVFFAMPDYPLIHLGLGIPVRYIDENRFEVTILESVMNFVEANFQDWVIALETRQHTALHVFSPDQSWIATGRMHLEPETISGMIEALNQANSAYKKMAGSPADFNKAMNAFFAQYPQPFI